MISIDEIVRSGLCIGCGLCKSVAPAQIEIEMTASGVERPNVTGTLSVDELAMINAVCPGLKVELAPTDIPVDPIWGPVIRLARGHSAAPGVRFRSAAGGILSGLGRFVLTSKRVDRVLHLAPDDDNPLYWKAHISETTEDIMKGAGSRYGPGAPLTPLLQLIEEGRPLAVIAKPCDVAAVRNLMRESSQAARVVKYVMVMACGGASRMTKNWELLEGWDVDHKAVSAFRHRGYGNPGTTKVTLQNGKTQETSYQSMWEDQGTWDLQWRCKVCPDGMGEVADIVGLDCWPGGAPMGEDAGYDGIIVRTTVGEELIDAAVTAGAISIDQESLPVDQTLESWQPHQSRRKAAVSSRLRGMASEGLPVISTSGLRLDLAEKRLSGADRQAEEDGARKRIRKGRNI